MTAALKLLVTPAGRAALVNAKKNGTLPIVLDTVGVTATVFVPTGNEAQLPGEIKRIATIAGGAAAADTIHVTIRDSGSDTYSVRGVGFYLQDGTLFALYGQAAVVVEKSAQATMLLAMDVQFADIDATSITFGDTNFQLNQATTELLGVVELATDDETTTGTDGQRAVTPKGLLAAINARLGMGAPSAFVKGLLTAANATVLRAALALKSAAMKDDGEGNGLDADLLDGQHGAFYRSWSNLTGIPAAFPPTAHQHSAADITSGTLVVARGGTGIATAPAGYYLVGAGANPIVPRAPADVLTDIGAAAKQHSHPISDINGLQAALDAKTTPAAVAAQISAAVNGLINGAPGALDTLKELADAMGDDPNFAATVTNALAQKLNLTGGWMSGNFGIKGGSPNFSLMSPSGPSAAGKGYMLMSNVDDTNDYGFRLLRWNGKSWDDVFSTDVYRNIGFQGGITVAGGSAFNGPAAFNGTVLFNTSASELDVFFRRANSDSHRVYMSVTAGSFGINYTDTSGNYVGTGLQMDVTNGNLAATQLTINSNSTSALVVNNGGNLRIVASNGSSKYLRTNPGNGALEIVNNAYNAVVTSVMDGGDIYTNGAVVAAGGFQNSDKRLKKNIKARAVERGFALTIARMFCEWDRIADGAHDVGLVAQRVLRVGRRYVMRNPGTGMLAIDKAGIALESSMDNALQLAEQDKRIAALERVIQTMGKQHG